MLRDAIDLCQNPLAAPDAAAASDAFYGGLARYGVSYMQVRRYRRPAERLTAHAHWRAGGFVARYSRSPWIGTDSSNYVCFDCNPLLEPVARGVTRFRFSDYAPRAERRYGAYWEAMRDGGIGEALSAVAYGRDSQIASLHVGFPDAAVDADMIAIVHTAASILAERLLEFAGPENDQPPSKLSERERDAIAFVAAGKTDWEIGTILNISESTARFHVDNARRKLGAVNRAHAVARFLATHGLL